MKRRAFITRAGFVAAASGLAAPAIAQSNPKITWRLTSSYPKSLETLYGISTELSERINEISDGNFQIQVFAPGELVPGLQALDAVQNGTVECSHTLSSFYVGKNPAFAFDTTLPWGMNTRQHTAWLYNGGGRELVNEFMKQYNVHSIPAGNTGAQMGGWFRKEIKSLEDLKGLKMRIAGLGGTIMSRLGVIPQQIAGGDIYAALEKGTIDAVEFSGPYDDEKLGFNKVAPYYYAPGWWEGTANVTFIVNLDKWNELPKHYQAALETISSQTLIHSVAKYDAMNPDALYRLVANGAQLRTFPQEVMEAAFKESRAYYAEVAATNPDFKKFYDSWLPFWQKEQVWFRFAELPFDALTSAHAQTK